MGAVEVLEGDSLTTGRPPINGILLNKTINRPRQPAAWRFYCGDVIAFMPVI